MPKEIPKLPLLRPGCAGVSPYNLYQPVPSEFGENMTYIEYLIGLIKYINANAQTTNELNEKIDSLDLVHNGILGFDSVEDMKASDKLSAGAYAFCYGRKSFNDGLPYFYKIEQVTNATIPNEYTCIPLNDPQLVARILHQNGKIDVQKYGATPDNPDCYQIIQDLIDNFPHNTLYFKAGTYKISKSLNIKSGNNYQVDFELDNNATITGTQPMDAILNIGVITGSAYGRYNPGAVLRIRGGAIDMSAAQNGIVISGKQKQTQITDLVIYNVGNGVGLNILGDSESSDCYIDNVIINGNGTDVGGTGVMATGYDNKFNNMRVNRVKVGIVDNGSYYQNVHILASYASNNPTTASIADSIALKVTGANCNLNQVYFDTFVTSVYISQTCNLLMTNCQQLQWYEDNNIPFVSFYLAQGKAGARVRCENFTINHQENYIGVQSPDSDFINFNNVYQTFNFSNIVIPSAHNGLTFDPLFNVANYQENHLPLMNRWSKSMTAGTYYVLAILNTANHEFTLANNNDQIIRVTVSSQNILNVVNLLNVAQSGKYTLALCEGPEINGLKYNYLCMKSTSATNLGPDISNWDSFNGQIYTWRHIGNNTLTNPTILSEKSFNP